MNPTYTPTEKAELNAVSDLLQQYKSLFKYAPDVNSVLVTVCWKMLKRNRATIDDLNHVMAALALEITNYPTISQMRDELHNNARLLITEKKVTYSVISREKLSACHGDIDMIIGGYLSHTLFHSVSEDGIDRYIGELMRKFRTEKLFYEVAYCRLSGLDLGDWFNKLQKPAMTIPRIWKLCGLVKTDTKDYDLTKLIESIVKGMDL